MNRTFKLWGGLYLALLLFIVRQSWINASLEQLKTAVPGGFSAVPELVEEAAVLSTNSQGSLAEGADVRKKPVPLFVSSEKSDVPWTSRTPAAKRVCRIVPDSALLADEPVLRKGDILELALFEDAVFSMKISRVTRYPNGAVGITAKLEGGESGTTYLSYCGGELRASVERLNGDDYYVRYNPETQSHYAIQVDRKNSNYLGCGNDVLPSADVLKHAAENLRDPVAGDEPVTMGDVPEEYPEGTVQIDVMIVYTPAAETWASTNGGINTVIGLAMEKAVETHLNSDTRVYLNLAHSAETAYTETASASTDLSRLRIDGDGYMDDVHTLRDQYNADLVCLFQVRDDVGGLGNLLNDAAGEPDRGFSLARVQQADWTYTVVHEWGHNMGCGHSASQASQAGPGLFDHSSGWQWADTASPATDGYCSVMTYEDSDDDNTNEYRRVAYFSNPNLNYTGNSTNPTGDASDGDNACTIREVRYAVVDYRISSDPVTTLPSTNSFENGFVNWRYDEGGTEWFRDDGSDVNLNTAVNGGYSGTTSAHSGSYFLMFDAAFEEGSSAFLDAVFDFRDYSSVAIEFWYYMQSSWSSRMGDLTLQVSTNSGSIWSDLWTRSGDQGSGWKQAKVSLSAYDGMSNVLVRIRANIGSHWPYNYLCLDDVAVSGIPVFDNDIDGDGIPNDWETQYYGGETNANSFAMASNGINTVLEAYIAGLDPTNSASKFTASGFSSFPAESVLQWQSVSGRVYSVYWTTNLLIGFPVAPVASNITSGAYTDSVHDADSEGFYRIEVHLAP